jgi:hypothetical protein
MNKVSPEQLDALLQKFGPKRREPFSGLKPHGDLIQGLRRRGASLQTIHQVLQAQGVKTCPTMIREYCRKVLAERGQQVVPKTKKAKPAAAPPLQAPHTPMTDSVPVPLAHTKPAANVHERPVGPRIAKVEYIEEPKI